MEKLLCTLTPAELATRGARWRLLAGAFAKVRTLDDGLRLVFRPDAGVEAELRELALLETDCCSFAEWRVHADDGCVMLDVVAKDRADLAAVQSMFATLRDAAPDTA